VTPPVADPNTGTIVTNIHPTAIVSPLAEIHSSVKVGPFCIIEENCVIGEDCEVRAHSVIKSGSVLGARNRVFEGAVIGGEPQHLQGGEAGTLLIGDDNTIREQVTIHRGLKPGQVTQIGDHNFIMIATHIAHDCIIGNHTILANNVLLAGHIEIHDRAFLSGAVAVHQFVRIGAYTMVGGQAHIKKDVPPYVTVDGNSSLIVGLNKIGLQRNGFDNDEISTLKKAYRLVYRSGMQWKKAVEALATEFPTAPANLFSEFFAGGHRGFLQERRQPSSATIPLRKVG